MAWIPAAIGAGGSILGGLASGGGQGAIHPMDNIPDFLHDDYMQLAGGVANLQTPEYYQGQLIADQNPYLQNSLAGMGGFGAGMGGDIMNSVYGAGQQSLGAIGQGLDYMGGLRDRGANRFQYDQGTFDQIMGNLQGGMQNTFDLGANQIQQNFDWNQLPGLNMQAALSGGEGSTKFGQAGALGQAMANQNIQSFGTNLWQNAANQANQGAMSGGAQNLAGANNFDQQLMSNYGNYGQLGGQLMGQGYDMGRGNLNMGLQAGQYQQNYDQSIIDADQAKWNFEQQAPWMALQQQLGMLPGPGGSQPAQPGMSPWEGALQGAQMGLGLYGAGQEMGWWGSPPPNQYGFGLDQDLDTMFSTPGLF